MRTGRKKLIKLIELIKKLRVLAQKGEPNERIVAQIKINEICSRYSIDANKLFFPKPRKKRVFKLNSFTDERDILIHCILDTLPEATILGNEQLKQINVMLTDSEYQDTLGKFNHFWFLYLKERESLLSAFILKNNIGIIDGEQADITIEQDIESVISYINIVKEDSYISKKTMKLD